MAAKTFVCTAILLMLVAFKFWLIAGMEITDESDDPPNYVAQILHPGPSFFGPGTGLAGSAFRQVHLPFRTGIELAWLGACALTVGALLGSPFQSGWALALFTVVSFHPAAEELFSHILSDPLGLVTLLGGVAAFVLFAGSAAWWRWPCLALAGVSLGLAVITRPIFPPLLASLVLWAAMLLMGRGRRPDLRLMLGTMAGFGIVAAIYFCTCSLNASRYGYHGISLTTCREYRQLYLALQSVGEPTGDPYYPVDTARLELAAQAGPSTQLFTARMLTDQNFRRVSQEAYGRYDFALAWFAFPVFFNTVPDGRLDEGFALYRSVETEIAQAGAEHRLPVRAILPLPDARVGIVLSVLPKALVHVACLTFAESMRYAWADLDNGPRFDNAAFTAALTRREVLPTPWRDHFGAGLCTLYRLAGPLLLPGLVLTVAAYAVMSVRKRSWPGPVFLSQQLFLVTWLVLFGWYTLFDASGFRAVERYLIYQNVLLPLLIAFYARAAWRIESGG